MGKMQFKRSAGIFLAGFFMSLGGYIFGIVGASSAASSSGYYSSGPNGGAVLLAIVGFLVAVAGSILILVAVYRAFVKIDALPVATAPTMQNFESGRISAP